MRMQGIRLAKTEALTPMIRYSYSFNKDRAISSNGSPQLQTPQALLHDQHDLIFHSSNFHDLLYA
jgi:hypothetical protein